MHSFPVLMTQLRGALSTAEFANRARVSVRSIQLYEAGALLPSGRVLTVILRSARPSAEQREAIMAAWTAGKAAQNAARADARRAARATS